MLESAMVPLGVERSRWLGELAQAIDDAQQLVWEFGSAVGLSGDTLDLYARLEVVRDEIERMRRARRGGDAHPKRSFLSEPGRFEALSP
jgi:hypothetical protein